MKKHQQASSSANSERPQPANPGGTPPLWQKIQVLESNQNALVRAFDHNSELFTQGLQMLDAHCMVYRRICNMLTAGIKPQLTPEGIIDFDFYLGEYFGVVGFINFVDGLKTIIAEEVPLIVSPHEQSATIFGGDL